MDEKESILIIDDDESTGRSLELVFGKKGYETEIAVTGREAMEKAERRFFNLALVDIKLPDMEGIELLAPLHKIHPDMVMIMATGYASVENAVRALNEGASAYVTKPLDMDDLLARVREAIEKQSLVMENRRLYREVRRELAERKRAEEELQQAHDTLETRVEERTAALGEANESLRAEITQRKRMEKELRAKEMQIIHADRLSSLGEMATGVAHEINQPLAIISMAAEGRLRDIERGRFDVSILPQELEDILKNVRRIDRIITHMRTFSGRVGERESVNPEGVLDNVFILLGEQFRMHKISISREIEAGLPSIKVDVNQLEQVFVNILTNARQTLDEKAEEAERDGKAFEKRLICGISRAKEEAGEYIIFEFADNAYGVPDELKTRVFEPFFTTKEVGKGTGLGLSVVYGIVTRSLGGRIWVEDNAMGGASFKVALPVGEITYASTS